ncbi:MAG: tripartite tricarboxylate transporter substrate binding protein, partial [Boseongicola sp.]|nr:tripartite tricarboxylate transporter substrate binding protein [Boseongicola sp.]
IFVRKDTPAEAREVISRIARAVVESPEAQEIAANAGAVVQWMPADEAAQFAEAFYTRFENLLAK